MPEPVTQPKPSPEFDRFLSVETFGSLDGLRCLAIVGVVWHHYKLPRIAEAISAAKYGFLGVDLFFVLSGFLIVSLLLREQRQHETINLRDFYIRRALRIFPLYYGVLALMLVRALFKGIDHPDSRAYLEDLPILAVHLANWIPGHGTYALAWSLAAEEQFYAFWPPLEKYLRRWVMPLLALLLIVSQLIQLGAIDPLLSTLFGWGPKEPAMLRQTTFTPILLGVLLAHSMNSPRWFELLKASVGHRVAAPALLLALLISANFLPGDIRGVPRLGIHLMMFALVGACVVREDHGLVLLLRQRGIRRIGQLSYSIYLLHHMGMDAGFKLANLAGLKEPAVRFVLGLLVVYVAAELSFRFYERPFTRMRARFRPNSQGSVETASSATASSPGASAASG